VTDARGSREALVRADGTLSFGPVIGSIHKIGALAQGLPACNGWVFWHYEDRGRRLPIDRLRDKLRRELVEAA
jgi:modification methylase